MENKNLKTLNVEENLHAALKIRATKRRHTLQEELTEILEKELDYQEEKPDE